MFFVLVFCCCFFFFGGGGLRNHISRVLSLEYDYLVGLVVKAFASRAENPGFESRLRRDISGSSHTSDFKIRTPVATLPGAWRYRVSAGTNEPGVSISAGTLSNQQTTTTLNMKWTR